MQYEPSCDAPDFMSSLYDLYWGAKDMGKRISFIQREFMTREESET